MELIEPAVAFLHEHAVQRAHTADTLRTYAEILYDWFETLEQNRIAWSEADAADLIAYRNRMLKQPSAHTQRPYSIRTINHRVRGVLRFYAWAVRGGWLRARLWSVVRTTSRSPAALGLRARRTPMMPTPASSCCGSLQACPGHFRCRRRGSCWRRSCRPMT